MAQAGPAWGTAPHACGKGGPCGRIDRAGLLPSCEDEADDWETDPDYINDAPGRGCWWGDGQGAGSQISTASIISDLSNSIRGCELNWPGMGKPGAPPALAYENGGLRHPPLAADSPRETLPRRPGPGRRAPPQQPYSSVYLHSSAGTGIERGSVFECNAAETLDTFFYEKLKACEEAPPAPGPARPDSGSYENEEPGPEAAASSEGPTGHQGGAPQDRGRRHRRSHPAQRGREVLQQLPRPGDVPSPSACTRSLGLGQPGAGPVAGLGCSSPCLDAGGPPQILPRCVIAHLQSCMACQQFNQSQQAWPGERATYENSWGPREEEGAPRRRARSALSSHRQLHQRLCQVQKWLEQSAPQEPLLCPGPEPLRAPSPAAPSWFYPCDSYRTLDRKEEGAWRRREGDGDLRSCKQPAEPQAAHGGRRGKSDAGNATHHQEPSAATVPRGVCSCLFCEPQQGSPGAAPGRRRGAHARTAQPGAAAQLQAESRVQRIVEAFERRSRREAKRAVQEQLLQAARQRELDARARAGATKGHRGARARQPQSGSRPPRSLSGERWREAPRPEALTKGRPQGSRQKGDVTKKKKRPSSVEKLGGHR
ncbi:uncharacterized protein LOC142826897 [Pelodiscus sinensis]|uniref:uncharacterized protein LOC142826897 n=1 Tax=Pelodiscus sinensis TaxID=13735 RepID=UPI003F6B13CC